MYNKNTTFHYGSSEKNISCILCTKEVKDVNSKEQQLIKEILQDCKDFKETDFIQQLVSQKSGDTNE